jgi:hypothetical protein
VKQQNLAILSPHRRAMDLVFQPFISSDFMGLFCLKSGLKSNDLRVAAPSLFYHAK